MLLRAAVIVATLFALSLFTFLGTQVVGDPARAALGRDATPSQIAQFREEQGLDEPTMQQYADWIGNVVRGDWGISPVSQTPVAPVVYERLGRTLALALLTMLLAVPAGLAWGVFMAKRMHSRIDMASVSTLVVAASVPEVVVGLVLLYVFAIVLGVAPVDGSAFSFGSTAERFEALVLPAVTLTIGIIPYIARVTRATVRETMLASYTRAATLRGLPPRHVTWAYGVRNAASPILTVTAMTLGLMLSGVVIVENIFGIPGAGNLLVTAINTGDYVTTQMITMVTGAIFVILNLTVDQISRAIGPRSREAR